RDGSARHTRRRMRERRRSRHHSASGTGCQGRRISRPRQPRSALGILACGLSTVVLAVLIVAVPVVAVPVLAVPVVLLRIRRKGEGDGLALRLPQLHYQLVLAWREGLIRLPARIIDGDPRPCERRLLRRLRREHEQVLLRALVVVLTVLGLAVVGGPHGVSLVLDEELLPDRK